MHDHIPTVIIAAIVLGYLVIAGQFFIAAKGSPSSQGRKALFLLLGIFILCSIAGYLPRLIGFPFVVELAIHVALVLATWWFIFTRQAAHIMQALK